MSYFTAGSLKLVGRVQHGTSDEWISSVATAVVRRTRVPEGSSGPMTNALRDSAAVVLTGPILESLAPSIKPAPQVAIATRLVGVTIIVLLIACANVASLLLARGMTRRREIAVRIALGVSRRRLVAQLLCEGIVLSLAAGGAALVMSWWGGEALRALIMPGTNWSSSPVDARVVLFIGVIALATGVLAGLVPALQASKPDLTDALRSGPREGLHGVRRSRLRRLLLVVQIAMSVLLLYGARLFVHSLMRLRAIDMGFDAERVVYASVYFLSQDGRYVDWQSSWSPRTSRAINDLAPRLRGAPGVEQVAISTGGPMGSYSMIGLYMADGSRPPRLDNRDPSWIATTPDYLKATGSRLVRGRFFSAADADGAHVMVVNEAAARTYWPQQDPLGKCLHLFSMKAACSTVIGVVQDSHVNDVVEKPVLQLITPFGHDSAGLPRGANTLIIRAATGQTAAVEALVRREIARAFPTSAVPYVQSVSDSMADQLRPWRVGMLLFGAFGILALVIAALGTYSVLSYSVTERLHEIGVRMALGARRESVVRLVVSQGLWLAMIGVAVGTAIALVGSRVMQALLYDTSPHQPVVTVAVAMMLLVIATLASALPARRAARVDPATVLRAD